MRVFVDFFVFSVFPANPKGVCSARLDGSMISARQELKSLKKSALEGS